MACLVARPVVETLSQHGKHGHAVQAVVLDLPSAECAQLIQVHCCAHQKAILLHLSGSEGLKMWLHCRCALDDLQ